MVEAGGVEPTGRGYAKPTAAACRRQGAQRQMFAHKTLKASTARPSAVSDLVIPRRLPQIEEERSLGHESLPCVHYDFIAVLVFVAR